METKEKTSERILKIVFKEPFSDHTASSLAKTLNISRQGVWKTLTRLLKEEIISLKSIGDTKKSTFDITLNSKNPVTAKTLSLLLEKEAVRYEKWRDNFKKIEKNTLFTILFGSILHSPKEANDIDLLMVVKSKQDFKDVERSIIEAQQTQIKKIHALDVTQEELKTELKNKNRAYIEAIKKGVVLFGQDNFIKFIMEIST